ncbi:hypothetical protein Clacol_005561 [Clathrus columnatus]|uniref:HTH APSES-type domain-containing protein n=1 Tax=Clathrus columnatus TaxID=1419009 RepID=A0AAV5ADS2_9AGAM|nr:hypothetical protein Clacol_005561 [Clathrus columnatus]
MATNQTRPPSGIRIYNAVYSSVQVYECMIRGIAVMRRRADSYVNATQILKVAGIDKGRRTKILEKEILPGKHEIVQGGYGKYQGTWIPLERGRDVAAQFGVAHLLTPLFDYMPAASTLTSFPTLPALAPARPPSGSPGFPSPYVGYFPNAQQGQQSGQLAPPMLPSPNFHHYSSRVPAPTPPRPVPTSTPTPLQPQALLPSPNYVTSPNLKRPRSTDVRRPPSAQSAQAEAEVSSGTQPPQPSANGEAEGQPSPAKRPRLESAKSNGAQTPSYPSETPAPATAHTIQMANKPTPGLTPGDKLAPLHNAKRTAILGAISQQADPQTVINLILNNRDPASDLPADMDVVLDDQGHASLHLAASLGNATLAQLLVQHGANPCTGNYAGETPLIRTVLSLGSFQAQDFPALVSILHSSIRTLDGSHSTVLHHIAHVAGIRGRAAAARYYMEGVLMWVAEHEDGDFKSLVDIQDIHGDTALNIAARVGNRSLVKTLLDCGANRTIANKLGLRSSDFGLDGEDHQFPKVDDFLAQLRGVPSVPIQKSKDVIGDMTAMINNLSTEFQTEIKTKQDVLASVQSKLRASTRSLADQRRQIQTWQLKCGELDQVQQRIRNIERALVLEDRVDWTGRTAVDGEVPIKGPFAYQGPDSTLVGVGFDDMATNSIEFEPPIPEENSHRTVIKMRRMQLWLSRTAEMMRSRLKELQGASAEKEFQCKKIVSLCTGVPIDQIEQMLENLVIAVESEPQIVDLGRVAGFMQKV